MGTDCEITLSMSNEQDYSAISPSAASLLMMKGHTAIPYARELAGLISSGKGRSDETRVKDFTFWARVLHFERRYVSIDVLMNDLECSNILELASGFSCRGLDLSERRPCHYIDTDLPQVVEQKKEVISRLSAGEPSGTYELLPLNALDETAFMETVGRFPQGPVLIINEGLLMYLGPEEKEKLCRNIHGILKARGGYWICADIYIRDSKNRYGLKLDSRTARFFGEHKIEEKKFGSFREAGRMFEKAGFAIDAEARFSNRSLSSFENFRKVLRVCDLFRLLRGGKSHATWRLKPT